VVAREEGVCEWRKCARVVSARIRGSKQVELVRKRNMCKGERVPESEASERVE